MTPTEFLRLVLRVNFARAIQLAERWEVWAQIEIGNLLLSEHNTVAREIKYPGSAETVDLAFQLNQQLYVVELKVQTVNKNHNQQFRLGGEPWKNALGADVVKLRTFNSANATRWVVAIAYTADARAELQRFNAEGFFTALEEEGQFTAVLVDCNDARV